MPEPILNTEQQQAIEHEKGPLLIIAGAGTGKTTVITQRIKHLIIEKKVPPTEILALTFTEKAAREMEERIDIALPYGYTQLWISTFHAFCDRILRDEAIHIGLNPGFKLATEAESLLFLRKHIFALELNYFKPLGNPYKFLQGLLQHFSRLKDDDISPEDYQAYFEKLEKQGETEEQELKKIKELTFAYKTYEKLKAKEGIMDFADLNANVLKLFRDRPTILKQYQDKFRYILIDEFQDTNYAQNELAICLAGKIHNITVVGDDDQAIYRWRGAAIANILQFKKHFPNTKVITLTKNYRSTQEILDASHKLVQNNNPDRLEAQEGLDKHLQAMQEKKGRPIEFIFGERVENEAESVVNKIQGLAVKHKLKYKDFAILVRANDHAQPFVRELERQGIPFQFLGPGHLFNREEIKDLIAYLKVLYNFEDNASLYRVLAMPVFQIEARDIAVILNYGKKKNLTIFQTLEYAEDTYLSDNAKQKVKKILDIIKRHLAKVPTNTAGQILYYFLEDTGLFQKFLNTTNPLEEQQSQNIAKFFEKLKSFEAEHDDASVFTVIDWIDLSMQLGESPLATDTDWSDNNAVNILTIHSSKGLEFPVVFVINLVTQRFPTRERKEQIPVPDGMIKEVLPSGDANLQEERRLCYVAMTRAKDFLFLTAANYYGEGKRERKLSPFVYEVFGEEYINKLMNKSKQEKSIKQLSLLDLFNDNQAKETGRQLEPGKRAVNGQEQSSLHPSVTYLSYSQIQCFDYCPLHYKLKYILKLPSPSSASQNFGISIHNVLRDYYQFLANNVLRQDIIIKDLLHRYWINEGYQSKQHEQEAFDYALVTLGKYIQLNPLTDNRPVGIEIPFIFPLRGIKVGGRIDRVDELPDGSIEIIDYKTGSNMPSEKDLLTNKQLTFYALAATQIHDPIFSRPPEKIKLTLHYVESNTKLSTSRSLEQLEEAKDYILEKVKEIESSDFACNHGIFCKDCEYKMLCNIQG